MIVTSGRVPDPEDQSCPASASTSSSGRCGPPTAATTRCVGAAASSASTTGRPWTAWVACQAYSFAGRFRSEPNPASRSAASAQTAGRTGTGLSRLPAKPGRRAAPCVSRRAHDLVRGILARSLFRLRHSLVQVRGNTGRPVGCGCHGIARVPGVDYARPAAAAQHVRKYSSHLLQARGIVSGVTQQPAAGSSGIREAGGVCASRLDSRDARARPGCRQSARPQAEGARAT